MSMMEEPREERKGVVVQMWLVSLGISVFCCAVFSALVAFYVGDLGKTLGSIDTRLATLETRAPMPTQVAAPSAIPGTVSGMPPVTVPSAAVTDAPTAVPSSTNTIPEPIVGTVGTPGANAAINPTTAPAPVPEPKAPVIAPQGSPAAEIPSSAPGAPESITSPSPIPDSAPGAAPAPAVNP